ncbi:MAG TPA: hypothetical protein VK174_16555 [Chitinophagales bacterium]|nr:hypothetical protein [Chitinophagales bacterium]
MKKLLPLFIALLFFAACKKETKELRTITYPLRPYNGSALTGQVSFIETEYTDTVIVKLEAQGLVPNTTYLSHLHTGTPGNLTGTLIYFHHVMSATSDVVTEEKWAETYDNALVSGTCFTIHNPAFFSNDTIGYELAGGTGANAQ